MTRTVVKELLAKFTGDTTSLDKASKRAGAALRGVKIAAAAATAATLATGGALFLLTKRSMAATDETAKFARSLGIPIAELQAMRVVAEEAGSSQEKLGASLTLLQRTLKEASDGVATYKDAYDELGLNTAELINLRPDEQFQKVAVALGQVENSTRRTALTLDLFGRGGREIINMLRNYTDNLDDARDFNERWNLSLSEIDSAKIEEANDKMARAKIIASGLGNTIATEVSPVITAMANELIQGGFDAETFALSIRNAMDVVAGMIDNVRISFLGLRAIIAQTAASIDLFAIDFSNTMFNMSKATREFLFPFADGVSSAEALFLRVNENAQASANRSLDKLKEINQEASEFVRLGDRLDEARESADRRAREAVSGGFGGGNVGATNAKVKELTQATKAQGDEVDKVNDAFKRQADITDNLRDSMGDFFADNITGFEDIRSVALNAIQDIARNLIKLSFGGSSGGGIGGSIAGSLFKVLGGAIGGSSPSFSSISANVGSATSGIPGFNTGGSFVVNGNAGVDRNILSMNGQPIANVSKGETVGVSRSGGNGVVVNQNINVTTGVQQTVRAEIMRLMPDIQSASTRAVDEARMRGKI